MLPEIFYDFRKNNIHATMLDGYLNLLPDEKIKTYSTQASEVFTEFGNLDVFATTVFGDLLAWDGEYIYMMRLSEAKVSVILAGFDHFFENLKDKEYQKDSFDVEQFETMKGELGNIESNECFIYEPVAFMGGNKEISSVKIGNRDEYIRFLLSIFK